MTDPAGLLSLPKRFHYTVVAETGVTRLESGQVSPDNYDGTAAFARPGRRDDPGGQPRDPAAPRRTRTRSVSRTSTGLVYDPGVHGGTTTIEVDDENGRVAEYVSLAGIEHQLRGRANAVEHLAHLRGDVQPGGRDQAARLRLRGGPLRPGGQPGPDADRRARPVRARGGGGRPGHRADLRDRGRQQPARSALPLDPAGDALPLGKGGLGALRRRRRRARGDAGVRSSGTWCPTCASRPSPGRRTTSSWVRCRTATRRPSPSSSGKQFNGTWGGVTYTDRPGGDITRSRKLEGAWWGDGGAYVVASFARTGDGSAVQHDGQVWFVDPLEDTITLKLRFAYTGRPGQRPRRAGQHHGVAVRRGDPGRGRRGPPAPGRRDGARARPTSWPATRSATAAAR